MTRVASNEKFKFSYKIFILMLILLIRTIILTLSLDHFFIEIGTLNFELSPNLNRRSYISIRKYINTPRNFILYITITYLLITLIIVVKITNINSGPLRQIF